MYLRIAINATIRHSQHAAVESIVVVVRHSQTYQACGYIRLILFVLPLATSPFGYLFRHIKGVA